MNAFKKQNKLWKNGFTLIELIVTVIVLAILTGLALPKFMEVAKDAKVATLVRDIDTLEKVIPIYYTDKESYPVENTPLMFEKDNPFFDAMTKIGEEDSLYKIKLDETSPYHTKLKHGYGEDENDYFVYSIKTGRVYYAKGVLGGEGELIYGNEKDSYFLKNTKLGDVLLKTSKTNKVSSVSDILTGELPLLEEVVILVNGEEVVATYQEKEDTKTFTIEVTLNETGTNKIVIIVNGEEIEFKIIVDKDFTPGEGEEETTTKPVEEKPVAVITMTPETGITTETEVSFSYENSTSQEGTSIVDAEWGGVLSIYPEGEHTVRLRLKDSNGVWSAWVEKTFTVVKANEKPVAVITMSPSANLDTKTTITWSYENSTDPDGDSIINAEWQGKQTTYTIAGSYTVKLRVQDERGLWSDWVEKTFSVVKANEKPVAVISMSPSTNLDTKTNITWSYVSSTDPDGDSITNAEWQGKQAIYTTAGSYTVKLRVQDAHGLWSDWVEKTFSVVKANTKPTAVITMSPSSNIETNTVITWSYTSSTDPDGDAITNVEWQGKQDRYTVAGTYTVKLRVQDNKGLWSDWVQKTFTVTKSAFTLATDADFSGTANGKFRYTGTEEYVEIPHIIKGVSVTSYYQMFRDSNVKGVKSTNTNVTNMSYMFDSSKATTLDLSNLNTSNVTNMGGMFSYSQIKTFNLSNLNTSNVTNMLCMFEESQATTLDLSSFDTSKVTNMKYMFMNSKTTTGYAKTQADANKFNSSNLKPAGLTFRVK